MVEEYEFQRFKKSDFDDIFLLISGKYDISHLDVKEIFTNTLSQIFNAKVICCLNTDGDNYVFQKVANGDQKPISFSDRIKKLLTNNFTVNLENYCKKMRIEYAKELKKNSPIIKVKVVKRKDENIIVKHPILKNCILPKHLIPVKEQDDYKKDTEHYLQIFAYSFANDTVTLSAKNNELDLYKIRKIFKSCEVYKINRYYGVRIKVYVSNAPQKLEFESLKLIFKNEKIKYIKTNKKEEGGL